MAEAVPPPRILVVDDASLVRAYYCRTLEAHGFETAVALNGLEAMEKVLAQAFDLLIVDINMPTMDGLTFLRTLRRAAVPASSTPALVASSESGEHDKQAARTAGANYYLVKPLDPADLVGCAAALTGRRP
jgi:two-component system chemotaxis response regulator CheY